MNWIEIKGSRKGDLAETAAGRGWIYQRNGNMKSQPFLVLRVPGPCTYEVSVMKEGSSETIFTHAGEKSSFGVEDIRVSLLSLIPGKGKQERFVVDAQVRLFRYDKTLRKEEDEDENARKSRGLSSLISSLGERKIVFKDKYNYTFKDKNGKKLKYKGVVVF